MGNKINIFIVVVAVAFTARNYLRPPLVQSPVVEITTGHVRGRISTSRDGRDYFEYLGVPYAKSPVNELRYEAPEPLTEKWVGVRDTTSYGALCLQADAFMKSIVGEEDCLFVNIHTPKLGSSKKLPVMVFFHGGLFNYGGSNMYRPDYFMDEDVVLVTVNYRLASFGFLNTGDGVIRGNMGLKDQNMALRWIQENIAPFGGNPNDVTIFGESAGGASVHFQMLSPMSKGLFHKAISQSGTTSCPWSIYPDPTAQAKRFAQQVKCPSSNTKEMVKCLKSKKAIDLVSVHAETADNLRPMVAVFLPTIEKDLKDGKSFLVDQPRKIIESGKFNQVPFLTGVNSAEGLVSTAPIVVNKTITSLLHTDWAKTLPLLMLTSVELEPKVTEKIKSFYLNGKFNHENPMEQMENLTNLFSDWVFNLGLKNSITSHMKQLSPTAPIYLYHYEYKGDFNLADILVSIKGDYPLIVEILWMKFTKLLNTASPKRLPCHGDELALEFYLDKIAYISKTDQDYDMSKKFIKLLIQFIKTDHSKKSELEFLGQKWSPLEANKPLSFMKLDLNPKMIPEPFSERLAFWQQLNLLK